MIVPQGSVEYVRVPVAILDENGDLANPTGNIVEIGFSADEDEPLTWHSADWETSESITLEQQGRRVATPYKARVLVGAGLTDLAVGTWRVWVRVTDAPETPVRRAGVLRVH